MFTLKAVLGFARQPLVEFMQLSNLPYNPSAIKKSFAIHPTLVI
jgi:hypothetical protein